MTIQEQAMLIAKKHMVAMVAELSEEVLFKMLEEAVKKSATPIDDVVLAALEAPLKLAVKDMLAKV